MRPRAHRRLATSLVLAATLASRAHADGPRGSSGYMGVQLEPGEGGSVRVVAVPPGSPAASAGLTAGDVIVRARGGPPGSVDLFTMSVRAAGPGTAYPLVVERAHHRVEVTVHLAGMPQNGVTIGSPAPPLQGQLVMGPGPADLARLRGHVVVLDFWASWCGPCRMLMPALNHLHQRYGAQGLTVLGVSDEGPAIARQIGAQMSIDYTLADEPFAAGRFGVRGLPTTIVIDRRGMVRRVGVGVDADEVREIDELVRHLLTEPAP